MKIAVEGRKYYKNRPDNIFGGRRMRHDIGTLGHTIYCASVQS